MEETTVVIDQGCYATRAGFATDEKPAVTIPTRFPVQNDFSNLEQECPFNAMGAIQNWDHMEQFWRHLFKHTLQVDSSETPVFLSETPLCPKFQKEKTTQIMFEQFNVPGLYIANTGVLSLYAAGRTTGIVVDIGDQATDIVPLYEGFCLMHAAERVPLAGHQIASFLKSKSITPEIEATKVFTDTVARDTKHRFCYVAQDFKTQISKLSQPNSTTSSSSNSTNTKLNSLLRNEEYALPDGTRVQIQAKHRFEACEILFEPHKVDSSLEMLGLQDFVFQSIVRCGLDLDRRKELSSNIILCGGTSQIEGLQERFQTELEEAIPLNCHPVKLVIPKERKFGAAWVGASILAGLASFQSSWIQKREYNESGPGVIHRKCF